MKKDTSSSDNTTKEYYTQFIAFKNDYSKLVINYNNLQNNFNKEVEKVNKLSDNTDKRFIYVIKKLEKKVEQKEDMIDVINMTKTDKIEINSLYINRNIPDTEKELNNEENIDSSNNDLIIPKISDEKALETKDNIKSEELNINDSQKDVIINQDTTIKKPGFFKRVYKAVVNK